MVSDSDLVTRLREILRSSDLDTTTPASVRRQLEADFGVDLTDKKGFVRDQIDAFLESNGGIEDETEIPKVEEDINSDEIAKTEAETEEDGDGSETDEDKEEGPVKAKKRRGNGFTKVCQLSPQLGKVIGTFQLGRTEVVKKMWAYIREKDLQDPKDRRRILCDESLRSLFRVKSINMFQMNKALSKHIWPLGDGDGDGCVKEEEKDEDEDEDEEDASASASVKRDEKGEENEQVEESTEEESEEEVRSLRKRKRKQPGKSVEKPKRKGGGGFTKVCSLSPELQAFTGVTELARTEVVKMLWRYIKENKLQDPKDRRRIICDESLQSLFSFVSINMFQMNKLITKHIWPLEDTAGESVCSNSPKTEKQNMETDGDTESDEVNEKDKKEKNNGCGLLAPSAAAALMAKITYPGDNFPIPEMLVKSDLYKEFASRQAKTFAHCNRMIIAYDHETRSRQAFINEARQKEEVEKKQVADRMNALAAERDAYKKSSDDLGVHLQRVSLEKKKDEEKIAELEAKLLALNSNRERDLEAAASSARRTAAAEVQAQLNRAYELFCRMMKKPIRNMYYLAQADANLQLLDDMENTDAEEPFDPKAERALLLENKAKLGAADDVFDEIAAELRKTLASGSNDGSLGMRLRGASEELSDSESAEINKTSSRPSNDFKASFESS